MSTEPTPPLGDTPAGDELPSESKEERVHRILDESRRQMQPQIGAEARGENVGDVMDFRMRAQATPVSEGTPEPKASYPIPRTDP